MTICALDELDRYRAHGVTHVLSIIDPDMTEPDVFKTYQPHYRKVLRFHDEIDPAPNLILPQIEHIETIVAFGRSVAEDIGAGGERHALVHCHLGISRSTAAMAMLLALLHPDEDEDKVFHRLVQLRPKAWPNCVMVELADDLLGRRGRLISALGRFYAAQLAKPAGNRPLHAERRPRTRNSVLASRCRGRSGQAGH
jgi:predicted protein tyrosine phosphatase